MFFDTHAHYDDNAFDTDRAQVLAGIREAGVELVVDVGCDRESSLRAVDLARQEDWIYAAVGTHPSDTAKMTDEDLDLYRQLCKSQPKVVAIGEIGLDYHWDSSPREVQKQRFRDQLDLAAETGKPVIIHERDAHADAMEIVRDYKGRVTGVFHCYSGAVDMAKELVSMGWYLGFTGVITYKNARKALEVLEWAPLSRIFLETDCPYLSPEPNRGRRNDSRNLLYTNRKLAEIKGLSEEETARITMENGKRFFGIS